MREIKYKLLIADDEYWTCEKLRRMIPWEKYDIAFMEPAENGEEVLEKMQQEVPDILISDINMPIMNGVELVEQVKEKYPGVIIFVVSGYDDFEYVKSTMRAGAINYLLKPITRVELIHAVSEALDMINQRHLKAAEDEQVKRELLRASSMMQDHEYSRLINKKGSPEPAKISVNISLDAAGYGFVLIKIHNMQKAMTDFREDMNLLSYTVKKELRDLLEEDVIVFNHISKRNEYIMVSKHKEAYSHHAATKYIRLLEDMFSSPVTVVLNGYSYSMSGLHHAYTQAVGLLMTRKYAKKSEIVMEDSKSQGMQEKSRGSYLSEEMVHQLQIFLKAGNKEMVKEIILRKSGLSGEKAAAYLDIKQAVRQINNLLLSQVQATAGPKDMIAAEGLIDEADRRVELLDTEVVLQYEEEIIDQLIAVPPEEENESMEAIVSQVRDYIDCHFFEELTLTGLAEKYMADSSYLSKSFKQYTGENLMMYISKKRIEKSIGHIREGKLSLSEISFLTGYDDYAYFSRVFKKITGMSPRDYKKKQAEKNTEA